LPCIWVRVVHFCPSQPTYCRSSSHTGQRRGGPSVSLNWMPQVTQMYRVRPLAWASSAGAWRARAVAAQRLRKVRRVPASLMACLPGRLLQLVNVAEHARRDAHDQDGQVALRLVADAPGYVDDHAGVQGDLLVVQGHRPAAGDDVVDLIRPGVVVQLRVLDL